MFDSVMVMVMKKYAYFFGIALILSIVAICITRKQKTWTFLISIFCAIGILILAIVHIGPVLIDYQKKDYIVEDNVKIICKNSGTSFSDLGNSSLTIITEDDREIHLLYSGMFEVGNYKGTIIYSNKSKIVVFYEIESILS